MIAVLLAAAAASAMQHALNASIFADGMGGYFCHRVPGMVNTGRSLLVFVESRHRSCHDQEQKDVNFRKSTDGGVTWGPLTRVLGSAAETNSTHTFRNPTPLHHTMKNGTEVLVLNVVNSSLPSHAAVTWPSLQLLSYDEGATWTEPRRVVGMGKYEGVLAGPGTGIQLGRHSAANKADPVLSNRMLFCGATGYQRGHAMLGIVWYSDDDGETWAISATVFPSMQECQLAELSNGKVVVNFRNAHLNHSCDCRATSTSEDGGQTWSTPVTYVPELIEPVCAAGLINTAAPVKGAKDVLFFSNPADKSSRDKMTVRRSDDSGASWPTSLLVWPGEAMYSVLAPINHTHIALAFENGPTDVRPQGITFMALPGSLSPSVPA
jgi:sialidase-1